MSEGKTIHVTVNGETIQTAEGRSVLEFLRNILKRPEWETTPLRDGARLEVVQFVGGG